MGSDLIHQLLYRDNWAGVEGCLEIFDDMPPTMRLCVDFKMSGDTNAEVAIKLKITENNVRAQLSLAKKRICRALTYSLIEDID
jgi:hypothetical protein